MNIRSDQELAPGITGKAETVVTQALTAKQAGSGELEVLATPMLIALAEEAAWKSVAPCLQEGSSSVGTRMDLNHLAATPVGMKVWCETVLTQVDRRRLVFSLTAYDEAGKIAEGTHERFIVDAARFQAKADGKNTPAETGDASD